MLILRRQDVQLFWGRSLENGKPILIIRHQKNAYRFLRSFREVTLAKTFCQNIIESRNKSCVLLEEGVKKYSVWLEISSADVVKKKNSPNAKFSVALIGILILQCISKDVETLLGARQAKAFHNDMAKALKRQRIPSIDSPEMLRALLSIDPIATSKLPSWQENHVEILLRELCAIGKKYFGNTSFVDRAINSLKKQSVPQPLQLMNFLLKFSSMCR
jgi:hypothetical protein